MEEGVEEEDDDSGEEDPAAAITARMERRVARRARRASAPTLTTSTPTTTFKPAPSQWSVEDVTAFIHTLPGESRQWRGSFGTPVTRRCFHQIGRLDKPRPLLSVWLPCRLQRRGGGLPTAGDRWPGPAPANRGPSDDQHEHQTGAGAQDLRSHQLPEESVSAERRRGENKGRKTGNKDVGGRTRADTKTRSPQEMCRRLRD